MPPTAQSERSVFITGQGESSEVNAVLSWKLTDFFYYPLRYFTFIH